MYVGSIDEPVLRTTSAATLGVAKTVQDEEKKGKRQMKLFNFPIQKIEP